MKALYPVNERGNAPPAGAPRFLGYGMGRGSQPLPEGGEIRWRSASTVAFPTTSPTELQLLSALGIGRLFVGPEIESHALPTCCSCLALRFK